MLLEGEEPESFAGESEEVLLFEGELEDDSAEEDGVWEDRPLESDPPQWSSPSEESDESPVKGTERIWLARCNNTFDQLIIIYISNSTHSLGY